MNAKAFLHSLASNQSVQRAVHTFWQAALGVLVAGIFAAHSSADVKAVIIAAVAAGAAAVKTQIAGRL